MNRRSFNQLLVSFPFFGFIGTKALEKSLRPFNYGDSIIWNKGFINV